MRASWILIISIALVACATAQPAGDAAEAEIRQASERFWGARERGDASAFAAQFTEDGILMIPGMNDSVGRDAIRELSQRRFANVKTSGFKVHRREIDVAGDAAYEVAWYSETSTSSGESYRMEGRYLNVWKRDADGAWRVQRNLYNFSAANPVSAPSD